MHHPPPLQFSTFLTVPSLYPLSSLSLPSLYPPLQIIHEGEKGAEALHNRLKDFCFTIGPRLSGTPQLDTAIQWVRLPPIPTPTSLPSISTTMPHPLLPPLTEPFQDSATGQTSQLDHTVHHLALNNTTPDPRPN